jgi:hypothetical protein
MLFEGLVIPFAGTYQLKIENHSELSFFLLTSHT